jgi:hypothetical protein
MHWVAAILFTLAGIALFYWRRPAARAQSFVWGATTPVGCVVVQAGLFVLVAVAFLLAHRFGMLGGR